MGITNFDAVAARDGFIGDLDGILAAFGLAARTATAWRAFSVVTTSVEAAA